MILVDTNVLVALADERDALHRRAKADLEKLRGPFALSSVVLAEACFLAPAPHLRMRMQHLIERLPLGIVELPQASWATVFAWLARFADHTPDLCDAQLCVLASEHDASLWSYDREFRTLWRSPEGKALRVVPAEPVRARARKRR